MLRQDELMIGIDAQGTAPPAGRIGAAYAASGYALLRYLERESRRLGTLETA